MKEFNIPGTVLSGGPELGFLTELAKIGHSGIVLSQIKSITGLENSAIQNWVKRGWVPPASAKHYDINQVSRFLMINALRGTMQLESIAKLLSYVNGNLLDTADDTIPDSQLYGFFCSVAFEIQKNDCISEAKVRDAISRVLEGYREPIQGAKTRLADALLVMALSYQSGCIRERAVKHYQNSVESGGADETGSAPKSKLPR